MKIFYSIFLASLMLFTNFDLNLNAQRIEDKIDVIIIDAGHGGKDPGAIGLDGSFEKDFNLRVAKKLKLLIENGLGDVKVILTRDSDKFIELTDRGKIANDSNGKLFVSIHANARSNEESQKSGFELYLLDIVRSDRAKDEIVNYKFAPNGVNDTLAYLQSSLILNSHLRTSQRLAKIFNTELTKGTGLQSRGVFQKPFVVLWGAVMPSILIECGYLTDEYDLNYLKSNDGENEIVNSIYKAIVRFKFDYEFQNTFN